MQRPLNSASPLHPRNGAAKRTVDAPVKPGMVRQTSGELHPYLHGQVQDDIVPEKTYSGRPVPVHDGMTDRQKAAHDPLIGPAVLAEAATLSRKPEKA